MHSCRLAYISSCVTVDLHACQIAYRWSCIPVELRNTCVSNDVPKQMRPTTHFEYVRWSLCCWLCEAKPTAVIIYLQATHMVVCPHNKKIKNQSKPKYKQINICDEYAFFKCLCLVLSYQNKILNNLPYFILERIDLQYLSV